MEIHPFFDKQTNTLTYVVHDPRTKDALIIDPVLDYDAAAVRTSDTSLHAVLKYVREHGLTPRAILETHAHADHLSGAQELKQHFAGVPVAIGSRITEVQEIFKSVYALPADFPTDGRQFDRLLRDGETVSFGSIDVHVLHTPGHTPACASYHIADALFTGDCLFMPDSGTGRCDFPGGSATDLYHSIKHKIYALPATTRGFTGHDYQPNGRELRCMATLEEQRCSNIQLRDETSAEAFINFRAARDRTLSAPRLLHPSVQVNIDAGHLPKPLANGIAYLRLPLNL